MRLIAPSGATATETLHVLTTSHFVRTWDWARLDDLHGERGHDAAGAWRVEIDAEGAMYRGGAQPSAAAMPVPSFPSAELRVFCEPLVRPHERPRDSSGRSADSLQAELVRVVRDVPPATRRAGASVRALLAIEEACTIDTLTVEIHDVAAYASGVRWMLVTPEGRTMRLTDWRYAGAGEARKVVATATRATGMPSAGLWENVAPRASGTTTLRRAGISIACAP